ncbi:MAG: MBL fold metallo-hydrolase [Rickettsiales bacterium]|jgi:ribonuclease J|nr:MBL fold metallo-hydrolase [Rickettsiales bacterium]
MEVRILRGTKEIGGSCVEVSSGGERIILDIGLPLDTKEADVSMIPEIKGILQKTGDLKGVIVSHYHQDHSGLLPFIDQSIPVAMGTAARNIMNAGAYFQKKDYTLKDYTPLENQKTIYMGKFKITPYIVDHSAYDAYALLIEADGKKLFYSGDLRAHGRKAKLFDQLLYRVPKGVDCMLLEGSSLGRLNEESTFQTEDEIEDKLIDEFHKSKGVALVVVSGQNIDRIVSLYRAAKRTGKELVLDPYVVESLRATGNEKIPQYNWPHIKIYIPEWERAHIAKTRKFDLLEDYKSNRVFLDYIEKNARNIVMFFRPSMTMDLEQQPETMQKASCIYSMWEGYLFDETGMQLREFLDKYKIGMSFIHTSGHADIPTLKKLVEALNPKQVIPIHTFEAEKYPDLFPNVAIKQDGEWFSV